MPPSRTKSPAPTKATPASPPADPPADPPAHEPTARELELVAQLQELRDARAAQDAEHVDQADETDTAQEPAAPALKPGDHVAYRYDDVLSGPTAQHGVVLDVDDDGRAVVGWFSGVSGPLPVDDLEPARA